MSIATELIRLQTAKENIKTSLVNKGAVIADDAKLDEYSTIIDELPSGGGGDAEDVVRQLLELSGTEFVVPNYITQLGASALMGKPFTSITIPNHINSIPASCFANCSSLTTLNHGDLISIGNGAFLNTLGNDTNDGIKYLGDIATIIATRKAEHTIKEGTKYISGGFSSYNTTLISIDIAEGVVLLGESALSGNSNLTTVTLPSTLKYINDNAFNGSKKLNNIVLPEGLLELGKYAFYNCTALTSINIPNQITAIRTNTFQSCTSLAVVNFGNTRTTIPTLENTAVFNANASGRKIVVPDALYDSWKQATNWSGPSLVQDLIRHSTALSQGIITE